MYKLLLAIIEAAPLFGDRQTFKELERIRDTQATSPRRVELASEAILAAERLYERLDLEASISQLLRPAQAPEADALLRPAAESSETPDDQLLRPISNGE